MLQGMAEVWQESRILGPGFALRRLRHALGAERCTISIRGVGPVTVRLADSDVSVFRQVFLDRQYVLKRTGQYKRILASYHHILDARRIPLVIDAGASVAASSLFFAREFPWAQVLAIEPDPESAELCRSNTAQAKNVRVVEAALGARAGAVVLNRTHPWSWRTRTERSEAGTIPIVTVPDLIAASPDTELFIVKIDIEGFEVEVFEHAESWLSQAAAVLVEPHDWMLAGDYTSQSLLAAVGQQRFEMLITGDSLAFIR